MKRFISFLLCIVLFFSNTCCVQAKKSTEPLYRTISAEFSDKIGSKEMLQIMIQDNHVYINAKGLGERLGYTVKIKDDSVAIVNNKESDTLPYLLTIFYFDSQKVEHMLFAKIVDNYEAPFVSLKNDQGAWIPFEYSLLLMNSSMILVKDTVVITMPEKNIIDILYDIGKNTQTFSFEWYKDFGYTDFEWETMGYLGYIITMANGLLDFDGSSWLQFAQMIALSGGESYDMKYGERIAILFCTYSDKELKASVNETKKYLGYISDKGALGKTLSVLAEQKETDIGAWYQACEELKQILDGSNSSVVKYNKAYQALERASDKSWYTELGDTILATQKGVSKTVKGLNVLFTLAEITGYAKEFQNQDDFSVQALKLFIADISAKQSFMPEMMMRTIAEYISELEANVAYYSAYRHMQENVDDWIASGLGISGMLGTQATIIKIAWDLASDIIPFIKNGIDSADQFTLAMYVSLMQSDAFIEYQSMRNDILLVQEQITSENLYGVSQYCYIYLKSCFITREAAIASLAGKEDIIGKEIKPLVEYQEKINQKIAEYLIKLKNADIKNSEFCYGFLPEDSDKYLKMGTYIDWKEYLDNTDENQSIEKSVSGIEGQKAIKVEIIGDNGGAILFENGDVGTFGGSFVSYAGKANKKEELGFVIGNIQDISAASSYIVALDKDNNAWIWGHVADNGGLIGLKEKEYTEPYLFMSDVKQINLSESGFAGGVIKTDDSLWIWSDTCLGSESYRLFKLLDDVERASIGNDIVLAQKKDGTLWIWGYNWGWMSKGEDDWKKFYEEPIKIANSEVLDFEAEESCFAVIRENGDLYVTGEAYVMNQINNAYEPKIGFKNIQLIDLGYKTCCMIDTSNNLYTWGDNSCGALASHFGNRSLSDAEIVMENVISASVTNQIGAAVTKDGCVYVWGKNDLHNQLGVAEKEINYDPILLYSPSMN